MSQQETKLSLIVRSQHHITVLTVKHTVEINAHIRRLTVVVDFVHYMCCIFDSQRNHTLRST